MIEEKRAVDTVTSTTDITKVTAGDSTYFNAPYTVKMAKCGRVCNLTVGVSTSSSGTVSDNAVFCTLPNSMRPEVSMALGCASNNKNAEIFPFSLTTSGNILISWSRSITSGDVYVASGTYIGANDDPIT